jgi:DNA topoisomerase IB
MAPNPRNPNWGGGGRGQGRKPNPNKPRQVAETKLAPRAPLAPAEPKSEVGPAIDPRAWAMMLPEIEEISRKYSAKKERTSADNPFQLPAFPKAAVPSDSKLLMAQDSALTANLGFASNQWLAGGDGGFAGEGFMFLGYTYLSELALRPEYRVMAETIADDATRKWIDFDVVGDEKTQQEDREKDPAGYDERMADPDERKKRVGAAGKTDKVKALQDDQLRLAVRDRYYEQARNGGFFGRSHLFHDIRTNDSDDINVEELKNPIGNGRDALSKTKVPIGSFKALKTIEPMWAYPLMYNAAYPWRQDWYNPQVWYVNGQEFHGSRLLTFIPHPVPDMLKPAYAFGGLSLTQMAKPYVDRFITTVSSVNALIHSFSVMVLATDLSTLMQPGNVTPLMTRVAAFNMFRDNMGTFVINNKTEDFKNVSASLAGLHELQAQAQEHMAFPGRLPLVKFTGIQPAGLNASSEGEIEVYDDNIVAYQARVLDSHLRTTINFEQLSLWGEIDPEITHRWEKLRPITQAEKGQKDKDSADTHQKYVDMGAVGPDEVRKIIIADKELPYTNLKPDDLPEPPAEEGLLGPGAGSAATEFEKEASGGAQDEAPFDESKHPRDDDGKFGSGSGGSSGSKSSHQPTKIVDGKRVTSTGSPLPSHIQVLKIPPAWTDVTFSSDPKAALLATGKDVKGRRQAVYSAEFSAGQAAAKFSRINELNQKFNSIYAQNEEARKSGDPKKRAAADCAHLIMTTGIRPGSEDDTGAEKKAYGATTLEGKHVVVDGERVSLKFVGKKGVSLDLPVTDPGTAAMLRERKSAAGDNGQLFPINEKMLLDHVHSFDGGGFKTKDFRTLLGTRTAISEVANREAPKNEKDYKKAVMEVAKVVSSKLGNTPVIALQSYINPSVFAAWKIAA